MELEGEAHDEEITRALAASRNLADTAVNVQFDQFKTDLELDQACRRPITFVSAGAQFLHCHACACQLVVAKWTTVCSAATGAVPGSYQPCPDR
jgi:2-methylisocitrate lyase-like PEP mutase family enzyme